MADKIKKALAKLSPKERLIVEELLLKIIANQLDSLDIKRLKGSADIYRVRKGSIRVIFSKDSRSINILQISRRSEKTYKDFN